MRVEYSGMAIEKGRVRDEGLGAPRVIRKMAKRKKKSVPSGIRCSIQPLLLSTLLFKKSSFTGLTPFTLFFTPTGLPRAPALPLQLLSRVLNVYLENGSSTVLRMFANICTLENSTLIGVSNVISCFLLTFKYVGYSESNLR